MNPLQQRAFAAGCGLWILAGGLAAANYFTGWPAQGSEEGILLFDLFLGQDVEAGGVTRTLSERYDGLNLGFAVLAFLLGFLGLIWRRVPALPAGLGRRVAGMNAVAGLALLVLGLRRFPLPLLATFAGLALAFAVAALRRGARDRA